MKSGSYILIPLLLLGCSEGNLSETQSNVSPTTTNTDSNESEELLDIGQVSTIEIDNVILTSLPKSIVLADQAKVDLGRLLFWDPILSGDRDVACATCHLPEFGYADGRERSIGVGGVGSGPNRVEGHTGIVTRNAQTILNTGWNGINELGAFNPELAPMFLDNRTASLASQALEPIRSQKEMRGDVFSEDEIDVEIVSRLNSNAEYQTQFDAAYGTADITLAMVGQALADFQTTLIANNAPFDRWMRGDSNAMSSDQLLGMENFVSTGCADCHSGPLFSDFETHTIGVPEADGLDIPDSGDGNFGFRTLSLRQLTFTAPYFHGGQEDNLDDVVDFYNNPGRSENPNVPTNTLDTDFRNLPNVNGRLATTIVQFLEALSDDDFDRTKPENVPSGLTVGGSVN